MKTAFTLAAVTFLIMLFAGCNGAGSDAVGRVSPKKVGTEPVKVNFVEQDSYNIPLWIDGDTTDRILVRLSAFDSMDPVKPEAMSAITAMVKAGNAAQLLPYANVMNPDMMFTSANTVYLAHRLGIIKEVLWVIPHFGSLDDSNLADLKGQLLESFPDAADEIDRLVLNDKTVHGTVNGIPIRVVTLQDLTDPGVPVLLDIDSSYIFAMYKDERDTTALSYLSGIVGYLAESGIRADYVGITASNEDRRSPYRLRALSRYLMEMLENPEMVKSPPPTLWSERSIGWRASQQDAELSIPIYQDIIKNYPDDAATRYDLAEVYFRLDRLDDCGRTLVDAASMDKGYMNAFAEFAGLLATDGRKAQADRLFGMMPAMPTAPDKEGKKEKGGPS